MNNKTTTTSTATTHVAQRGADTVNTHTQTKYIVAPEDTHTNRRPRVVIIGAGFGGLSAARTLAKKDVDVLILDRNNYHGFWPLLYQVATAGLEPESIAHPVRGIIRKYENIDFLMADVQGVDFENKLVFTDGAPVDYDYLVIAAGSANNYFGNDTLAHQTFGMKDLDEAEFLRNHILSMFERAVREADEAERHKLLTLVVVGGGPTGVELAGAFIELISHVLRKDYPMLDVNQARVILVEASDRVLAPFNASLRKSAHKRLEQMGVEVQFNKMVTQVNNGLIEFKDGTQIEAGTVVWTAGVRGAMLADHLDTDLGRGARVKIEPTLNVPQHSDVFVIGDMAYLEGYKGNQPYPMVAPVAVQQGKQAAKNIMAQLDNRPMQTFRYFDKGQMATIGRKSAVLESFGLRLTGFLAWIGWLFVHLLELIGFRNRAVVFANWVYSYFTYDRGVRLITMKENDIVELCQRHEQSKISLLNK
ncbi:MAG: NAD(P)/FAD-dependent oxidoreductase [Chloroflexi bacterium AL-W]|nr:NAD(P)/FAD-dependent oxidoreductase [Chloroflexi bacterium AL-N1]NOK68264.1 NAD(P)/FAD-dependent oxidoreductase [Chloroflexi bacterium AL-N10]NOK73910.1 NAD(P)/FAD-dependent oxidoreductase [Chloroflexi bacterium AL-N5]NOK82878.1 NAD(P)/FAD-dependent oxidoreductase [Chloroflexi bacterium AL-W]NOK90400.1 NAD(P)/FAD-dependent oxidoreductase [Chloroflexi bacterium AL-N15]